MKSTALLGLAAAFGLSGFSLQAQYKAPQQYFRKDSPGVNQNRYGTPATPARPGTPTTPGTPAAPTAPTPAARPTVPKFKDLAVNTQFYFTTDTNRAFPWTKITGTTAKNAKGVTVAINVETTVRQ